MTVALYSNYKLVVKVEKPGFAEVTRFLAIFEVINYEYNMLLVGLNRLELLAGGLNPRRNNAID